jgi:hypothetical protein
MDNTENAKSAKTTKDYKCDCCDFITKRKNDYNRHLLTVKHKATVEGNIKAEKRIICNCGKEYKNRHGLSRHKKNCDYKPIEEPIEEHVGELTKMEPNINMFIDIIKENQEIKKLLLEQTIKVSEQNNQVIELHKENNILNKENNILNKENNVLINKLVEKDSIMTINNTTNNNQKFNLNFFLNETCKDAMNMKEFIDNIKVTFEEILAIGNTGFVNGVSDIFINRLKDMEVTKRPIHCTDLKRETIYLKDDDKWNKNENDNENLKNAIRRIEYKNFQFMNEWREQQPDARDLDSDNGKLWFNVYDETLQGSKNTREKIIKNISKKTTIDK